MDKVIKEDIQQMLVGYKKLAKQLHLSLSETLLLVIGRELIIMNQNKKAK